MSEKIHSIIEELILIESDTSVPKNVRGHIKNAINALNCNDKKIEVKIDKALEELGNADGDPNLPSYTRTKIWSVVSALESK